MNVYVLYVVAKFISKKKIYASVTVHQWNHTTRKMSIGRKAAKEAKQKCTAYSESNVKYM